MPGLTPAAWRKQAAIELGMDYATFLKLWKTKGKTPMVPAASPTLPAAASPGPSMGLTPSVSVAKKVAKAPVKKQYPNINPQKYSVPDTAKVSAKVTKEAAQTTVKTDAATIMTKHGPLDNALAKSAYQKMKKDMPGATPATLRKAAAEYLGVDYKVYLNAWKKKPTAGGAAPKPSSLPPKTEPTLEPSPKNKYVGKQITSDDVKHEFHRLFGKSYNPHVQPYVQQQGANAVVVDLGQVPTSVKAVIDAFEEMGIVILKMPGLGNYYKFLGTSAQKAKGSLTTTHPTKGVSILDITKAEADTTVWWRTINESTKEAWRKYTGPWYKQINSYHRTGRVQAGIQTADMNRYSRLLSDSMSEVKEEFTVFRGTQISPKQFKPGATWTDEGFVSTTISPSQSFGGAVNFEIVMPAGSKGRYIGQKSSHSNEREFLIDKGTKFKILSVDTQTLAFSGSQITTVRMVAIPK